MRLYTHNQIAYEAAVTMLENHRLAAVIHPTRTGKSFLAFWIIEDHPDARFLWLPPNDDIFENQKRNAERQFPNVEFMTFTKLLRLPKDALMALWPEYIILDEVHRCGAYCWGQGVERLLRAIYSGAGKGELSPQLAEALNAIGMVWGDLPDNAWSEAWELAREYAQANATCWFRTVS